MNAEALLAKALTLPEDAREAFLEEVCGTDADLCFQVKAQLQAAPAAPTPTGAYIPAFAGTPEVIGSQIGPYKLLQKLGEGGMGTVFLAEQTEPVQRRVALKLIKPGMDSRQVIARFEQERQALALMDHPNIAKVLDAGQAGGWRPETGGKPSSLQPPVSSLQPYFVMELVKGIPITKYCDHEHLTPKERLELFIPVCQAVQHAHQKGIIHRDLKPSNVIIALYDGKPIPKVIDFGVAKATAQKLTERTMFTEVGQIVGTLEYMAPEQAELNNLDIDTRADIYSLGVLLYELLTGSPPFTSKQLRGAAFDEMLRMIREVEPPKPSTKLSSSDELPSIAANRKSEPRKLTKLIHGDLDWIVMKALAKERSRRYETANGLALELQRYLADEPVLAGPPSMGYKVRKFAQRHRAGVLTGAIMALVLVTGTAVSLWQAVRATHAEGEALQERDRARVADQQARAERDRALAEKSRADKNFALARKAVEDYLTRVTDDPELKDRTDFTSLRKRLLESALPFYQQFALELGEKPEARAERGQVLIKLAQVQIESGRLDEAVKVFRQAREGYAQAVADSPNTFHYRAELVNTTSLLAYWLLYIGARLEAAQHYNETLRLADQLVTDFPQEPTAHYLRARVFFDGVNFGRDRYEDAIRELRELVRAHPTEMRYQVLLAMALDNTADKLSAKRQAQDAEKAYREAIAIHRQLYETQPQNPDHRHQLANVLFNYGAFLNNWRRPAEALPLRQEAGTLLRRLVQDFPSNVRFRHLLARNQNAVGLLQQQLAPDGATARKLS
jgi:serine/threonine protein kinase/tetratricopeptide (TPR) repeat protein